MKKQILAKHDDALVHATCVYIGYLSADENGVETYAPFYDEKCTEYITAEELAEIFMTGMILIDPNSGTNGRAFTPLTFAMLNTGDGSYGEIEFMVGCNVGSSGAVAEFAFVRAEMKKAEA